MKNIFNRLLDKTPYIALHKVLAAIDNEHNWGGWARPESEISDRIIKLFFDKYGTTQISYKSFEDFNIVAGYYYIPREIRRLTADSDNNERIAVFQRVPLFKGAYRDVVLIKTYECAPTSGEDMLSLMSKSLFLDGLIGDIHRNGGLPVHQNTKAPT